MKRNVLPADPRPEHYVLHITPNFTDFSFRGVVDITLVAAAPTDKLVFNATELTFIKGTVGGETFAREQFELDDHNERATLKLAAPVSGTFKLVIEYTGTMNDKMKGFYRSKYTIKGQPAHMGTTQFEPVDCRRALPCWDEPVHKATFEVSLTVPSDLSALSNTAVQSTKDNGDGTKTVAFERTPKMSTYLLAWTIGDLEYIERAIPKRRGGETLVRIYAAEGKITQAQFALDVACKVLPLYEDFFGSDYVLSKVDLIAIPDFAAGAMENWGMITYRETALLCDENSSATHREWVALVVAHELAHQWFGNLVTMDWWKELWLNESFATWVEYWAVDQLFPEWQVFTQFVNDETGRAMDLDGLKSSHPIEVDLENAHEIDDIFDAISYSKGGSVLRMAVEFIGMDAFKRGLIEYLDHFKFANAKTKDLWDYLGKAAGKDLTRILDSWVLKQGYPLLTVKQTSPTTIVITQERFLASGRASAEDDTVVWEIPLLIKSSANPSTEIALVLGEKTTTVTLPAAAEWVKVNSRQTAFCRVLYDDALTAGLSHAVATRAIGNLDRLGPISDYRAFAVGGHGTLLSALRLAEGYANEEDYTVWCSVASLLSTVRGMLRTASEADRVHFDHYVRKLCKPALERIGYVPVAGESHRRQQLRALLLGQLAASDDPKAIATAVELWNHRETTPIAADLRAVVYTVEMKTGGEAAVPTFRDLYKTSSDAMERARALRALGSCTSPGVLRDLVLPFVMSEEVRSQDAVYFVLAISGNSKAEDLYVEFFTKHWDAAAAKFPGMLLTRFVKGIGGGYNESHIETLTHFWATIDAKQRESMQRSFDQGIEEIRVNAAFARRSTEVMEYLKQFA